MPKGRILVTGASGLVGRACLEHYSNAGYTVTGISRNPPLNTYGAQFLSLDLSDRAACQRALSSIQDVTQIVFAALHEEPDLLSGWTSQSHVDRNGEMFKNCLDAVLEGESGKRGVLRNVTILQGPKAYGAHVHPIRTSAREDRDEDRNIPNFYWAQEDYLKARHAEASKKGEKWTWNVLRPALIVGMCVSGAMNLVAVLGVYASIMKERGEKQLQYPGLGTGRGEATDTRIIARCCEWCLLNQERPDVGNQIFNLTNGEIGCMYEDWPFLSSLFGMTPSYPSEGDTTATFSFRNDLPNLSAEWDAIRTKYSLKAPALDKFLGQSTQFSNYIFASRGSRPPSTMSTIKVRRAGFNETAYTEEMFGFWFEKYRAEGLLPPL